MDSIVQNLMAIILLVLAGVAGVLSLYLKRLLIGLSETLEDILADGKVTKEELKKVKKTIKQSVLSVDENKVEKPKLQLGMSTKKKTNLQGE